MRPRRAHDFGRSSSGPPEAVCHAKILQAVVAGLWGDIGLEDRLEDELAKACRARRLAVVDDGGLVRSIGP